MARFAEFACFVVDVGPHMHPLLPAVRDFLVSSIESKLLTKSNHEVAVVTFGSTGTYNEPHDEQFVNGDPDQYLHISVEHNFKLPDITSLNMASELKEGTGYSDCLDALTVAADMLVKLESERAPTKAPRRVVLISNFRGKGKGWDEEFAAQVAKTLQDRAARLEIIHLDFTHETYDQCDPDAYTENMKGVHEYLKPVCPKPQRVTSAVELTMLIKWVDVLPVTHYKGPLSIGKSTKIPIKVYKKVSRESVPSLKDYVVMEPGTENNPELTFRTKRARLYTAEGEPNVEVPDEDMATAHKYGRQAIPIDSATEELLKYRVVDKGMWLWGFMPADQIKRYAYMSESLVVVPDHTQGGSSEAVSALVHAMTRDKQVAGTEERVPDVTSNPVLHRFYSVTAHKAIIQYKAEAEKATEGEAGPSGRDTSPNPANTHTADTADAANADNGQDTGDATGTGTGDKNDTGTGDKAGTGTGSSLVTPGDTDPLVQYVFYPPAHVVARSEAARAQLRAVFHTQEVPRPTAQEGDKEGQAKNIRSAIGLDEANDMIGDDPSIGGVQGGAQGGSGGVRHVGTATPEEDFAAMVTQGHVKSAVEEMRGVITQLVDESVGSRSYDKAAGCELALRRVCVEQKMAQLYNTHLTELITRYKAHEAHAAFAARLITAGLSLITTTEAPDAEGAVSAEAAAAFLREHSSKPAAAPSAPAIVIDDDFDEVE